MVCTKPLKGINKKLGCACLRGPTSDETSYSMGKEDSTNFFFGDQFGLEPLNVIRGVVQVVRRDCSVKPLVTLQRSLIIASTLTDSAKTKRPPDTDLIVRL